MDESTIAVYNANAHRFAERYEAGEGGVERFFPLLFSRGDSVLDIGCGSGRDMAQLAGLGCDAWGLEPSVGLRREAAKRHPELVERVLEGSVPENMHAVAGRTFDGVCLSAVLMHIPDHMLFDTGMAVRSLMKRDSVLLVSLSTGRDDVDPDSGRDKWGRLFRIRPADDVRLLFERLGFASESTWTSSDSLGRRDIEWVTLIFRYRR